MATVRLELTYREIDFSLYDSIIIWRSTLGANGPFTRITAVAARGARVPNIEGSASAGAGPYINANGLAATFVTRDGTFTLSATGSDPMVLSDVASQLQDGSAGRLLAFISEGQLVVQTTRIGQAAYLEVSGDLATRASLPVAERTYGFDQHLVLIRDQLRYSYVDTTGDSSYFYKTQFRSSSSGAESEFSGVFSPSDVAEASGVVIGYVRLVDAAGRPAQGKQIRLFSLGSTQPGVVHIGGDVVATTDREGYAAFTVLRGATVQVVVDGTNLVRDVSVPTDTSIESFDLLASVYSSDDAFTVQRPVLAAAPRRSI